MILTKKVAAILGISLSLISACSTSIPISNEQISKDIFSKKHVVRQHGGLDPIISFPTGKDLKDPNGEEYHHCFKIDSSDFSKEIGQIEITIFNTSLPTVKPDGQIIHSSHIRTGSGKAKLTYEKKGDGWVFKDLAITEPPSFVVQDVLASNIKLTEDVSKPLCDIFDSSKSKK
jgi:hypothetical protein